MQAASDVSDKRWPKLGYGRECLGVDHGVLRLGADGRIVKTEVLYSARVDRRLPEWEKLARGYGLNPGTCVLGRTASRSH